MFLAFHDTNRDRLGHVIKFRSGMNMCVSQGKPFCLLRYAIFRIHGQTNLSSFQRDTDVAFSVVLIAL